jgi:hypothetical protein
MVLIFKKRRILKISNKKLLRAYISAGMSRHTKLCDDNAKRGPCCYKGLLFAGWPELNRLFLKMKLLGFSRTLKSNS